ncbi:MAG: DUF6458 family protein [Nocardioidaceae bacterium]
MAIGFGVLLIAVGAIFAFALNVDLNFIDDNTLGWILMIAGALAIVLSFFVGEQQRRRTTTHVEEHHYDA